MNASSLRPVLLAAALSCSSVAWADVPYNDQCGPVSGVYGRDYFDYLDPANRERLKIVEDYHFTSEIEGLVRGITGLVPAELDFVLRALPNHHRALIAMARWQRLHPKLAESLEGRVYTIECYLKRAAEVSPKDGRVRMIYATVLQQQNKLAEADQQYTLAEEMGMGGAELYYNRGLLKLQIGDVESARSYAAKAYELGYPLPGLREKLAAVKPATKPATKPVAPAPSTASNP
jgi:tetratricopeptide (TPR) repeat protein